MQYVGACIVCVRDSVCVLYCVHDSVCVLPQDVFYSYEFACLCLCVRVSFCNFPHFLRGSAHSVCNVACRFNLLPGSLWSVVLVYILSLRSCFSSAWLWFVSPVLCTPNVMVLYVFWCLLFLGYSAFVPQIAR